MSSPGALPPLPPHGPYPPTTAGLGGTPTTALDDPITGVFLGIFVILAAVHMTIFQINRKRGQKFIMSAMLFGFCMARIAACIMRIVWSTRHMSLPIAIAAQVFVAAGVLLLFIINLIFAQRIVRASHPHWAWATWFSVAFKVYYVSIVVMLAALITCTVQSFYTLSHNTRRIDRDVQLVGMTYFAASAFLPIPLLLRVVLPRKMKHVDKFGTGRFRTKIGVVVFSSLILTLGAAFRAVTAFFPRPLNNPAWYHSKPCFYLFNFTIEVMVVALFAAIRVDRRFHIPNGAHGPGAYSASQILRSNKTSIISRVSSEEEFFDCALVSEKDVEKNGDLGAGSRPVTGHKPEEGNHDEEGEDPFDKGLEAEINLWRVRASMLGLSL